MLTPAIVIPTYFATGFLIASLATRFGMFKDAGDIGDVIFAFVMAMLFWPLGLAGAALIVPVQLFYKYVSYLSYLGSKK